jgi:hypothetical protein
MDYAFPPTFPLMETKDSFDINYARTRAPAWSVIFMHLTVIVTTSPKLILLFSFFFFFVVCRCDRVLMSKSAFKHVDTFPTVANQGYASDHVLGVGINFNPANNFYTTFNTGVFVSDHFPVVLCVTLRDP